MANQIGNDIISLEVKVKASDAHAELLKVNKALVDMREELTAAGKSSDEFTKDTRYRALLERSNELHNALKKQSTDYAQNFKENEKTMMELIKARFKEESASLKELEQLRRSLRAKQSGTREGSDDWKKNIAELAEVENKIEKIKDEIRQTKAAMKLDDSIFQNMKVIGTASLSQLKTAADALNNKLANLTPATIEYIETSKKLSLVNARIKDLEKDYDHLNNALIDSKQILNSALGYAAGEIVSETLQKVGNALEDVADDTIAYGKALSELEAITGASGESLTDLEKRAENLTTITTEGGVKITNTATDILKAFKLVGSAKPELLGNAEALALMTQRAIIFQKASGLELPEAVKYLTSTMAQFNATADQSDRYINAIAAGAKEGATEIPDITSAIEEFGAGAASANFSIEESVALVETLGDKMIKGNEAGTALRNILIAIKAPDALSKEGQAALKAYNVDMNLLKDTSKSGGERLKELSKIVNDASAMVTVFGKENVTAAEVLLRNTKRFDELTKAVTGTNEAYRQASAMSNNLDNDIDNLKDTTTQLFSEFARTGVPVVRQIIQAFTGFLKSIKDNWDTIVGYSKAVLVAITTVSSYYATVKLIPLVLDLWAKRQVVLTAITTAYGYVVDILTGKIQLSTIAQQAFNTAARLNPIGLVISAVTAAVGVWSLYSSKVNEAVQSQKLINDLNATAQKNIAAQKVEMEQLLAVARDEKRSKDERAEAVRRLNNLSPQYLGNLTLEKINTDEAKKATDNYIASLERKAKAQAAFDKRTELEKELIDLQTGAVDNNPSLLQQTGNFLTSGGNAAVFAAKNAISIANNYNEKVTDTQNRIKSLNDYIGKNKIDISTQNSNSNAPTSTNNFTKGSKETKKEVELLAGTVAFLREELQKLNKAFENAPESKTPEIAQKIATATTALADAEEKLEAIRQEALKRAFGRNSTEVQALPTLKPKQFDVETLNTERQLAEAIADMKFDIDKKRLEKQYEEEQKYREKVKELVMGGIEAAKIASDAIFQIKSQNNDYQKNQELNSLEDLYKKRIAKAKGNAKETERLEKELDAKRQAIEREAFERQKKFSTIQAIINGALAITKILAEYPKFDFGIATAIGIGLAVATTAAQVAVIRNQKFSKGGVFQGASHAEGGIAAIDSRTGQKVAEFEGNEPYMILSRDTYKNNKQVVDALLDSSMNRGGAAIFANGGILTPNANASSPITTVVVGNRGNPSVLGFGELLQEVKDMKAILAQMPKELKAYIKWTDFQDAQDLIDAIKNKAFQ
jgi:TP901 family phage tail tape measure protein